VTRLQQPGREMVTLQRSARGTATRRRREKGMATLRQRGRAREIRPQREKGMGTRQLRGREMVTLQLPETVRATPLWCQTRLLRLEGGPSILAGPEVRPHHRGLAAAHERRLRRGLRTQNIETACIRLPLVRCVV
jgi:hypothetical protein